MDYLSYEQMEQLTTPRLLAYKRKKLHIPPCRLPFSCQGCRDEGQTCSIRQAQFQQAQINCKSILDTREHIPRKKRGS